MFALRDCCGQNTVERGVYTNIVCECETGVIVDVVVFYVCERARRFATATIWYSHSTYHNVTLNASANVLPWFSVYINIKNTRNWMWPLCGPPNTHRANYRKYMKLFAYPTNCALTNVFLYFRYIGACKHQCKQLRKLHSRKMHKSAFKNYVHRVLSLTNITIEQI